MAHKLKVNRGTTYVIGVAFLRDGVADTIAGATIRFTVKTPEWDATADDSTALLQKNVTSHTDAAAGLSEITLLPADTATITPGTYHYDVKIEFSPTEIYKLDEGSFILDGSPTNRRT